MTRMIDARVYAAGMNDLCCLARFARALRSRNTGYIMRAFLEYTPAHYARPER